MRMWADFDNESEALQHAERCGSDEYCGGLEDCDIDVKKWDGENYTIIKKLKVTKKAFDLAVFQTKLKEVLVGREEVLDLAEEIKQAARPLVKLQEKIDDLLAEVYSLNHEEFQRVLDRAGLGYDFSHLSEILEGTRFVRDLEDFGVFVDMLNDLAEFDDPGPCED